MYAGQKSIETVFLIAICRQWGDKWQSENTVSIDFLSMFPDSIDLFDCRLPGVIM